MRNGGKLSISAVVKAQAGVQSVVADLGGIETITLKPSSATLGEANPEGTLGLWNAEWTAHGLEEKVYTVTLRVTDRSGHFFENRSLQFSDPAAGNSTPGTTTYPNAALARIGAASFLNAGEGDLVSAVVDAAAGYAYFGTNTIPGTVIKVALGSGTDAPRRVGALTLNSGEDYLESAVIDTAAGYAYFGTYTSPGRVVQVALGKDTDAPTRVSAVTFSSGEDYPNLAVIDPDAGYAYFVTSYTFPGIVVKVALGKGAVAPRRVGALTLDSGESNFSSAVIDPAAGYAYLGTNRTTPGIVVKVALGQGTGLPTRVGALTLNSGEGCLTSAVIDPAAGYAYFGTGYNRAGIVVKVALGGTGAPTRVGALTLDPNSGEDMLYSAVIDPAAGFAYFGAIWTAPGVLVKVALGKGADAPTRVGALTLNSGEPNVSCAVIDPAAGYAYLGTYTSPGIVVKIGLSENGSLKATKITMPEAGNLTDVRFYSHAAKGNVRLAIYSNAAPKSLLWQSASVPNSVAGAFLIAPISSGTPNSLQLVPGTYWLGWQVDTNADVPSYTAGAVGDGFCLPQPYGAFPGTVTGETSTAEKWTEYITYLAGTATTVTSSQNPSTYGQSVTFTATVTGASPTGTVTFKDGSTTLGAGTLNGGTATYSTSSLAVGSHGIAAVYGGDGNNTGSTSATLTMTVNPRPITVTAAGDSRTYDGTTSSAGVPTITSGSLAAGDTATWTQTFDTKNVGTGKTLTPAGTVNDGNGGNNYSVTFVNDTSGVINPLAITVTAATDSKTYDGTTSSAGVPNGAKIRNSW